MGEEAPAYFVVGRIGGYGYNKGGKDNEGSNLYGRCCFERPGREEENTGELAAATATD